MMLEMVSVDVNGEEIFNEVQAGTEQAWDSAIALALGQGFDTMLFGTYGLVVFCKADDLMTDQLGTYLPKGKPKATVRATRTEDTSRLLV